MRVQHILETCLYVDDLQAAEAFYTTILGFELYSKVDGRHCFFRCGESMFLLFNAQATQQPTGNAPTHGAHGPGHVAFSATPQEIDAWRAHLQRNGVPIEAEVTWPGGGQSLYFRDPAGNSVELATPATWHLSGR